MPCLSLSDDIFAQRPCYAIHVMVAISSFEEHLQAGRRQRLFESTLAQLQVTFSISRSTEMVMQLS